MQSQDLGKPQIPPTFLAGRDFGLYCLLGLAYGVDEDDSDSHEEGDDGEGDLQDLLDDFFALDVGEATLFEQAGAVLLMMGMVMF